MAVLAEPLPSLSSASSPNAALAEPVVLLLKVPTPKPVLPWLRSHSCSHCERALDPSPSQLSAVRTRIAFAQERIGRGLLMPSVDCFCSVICVFIVSLSLLNCGAWSCVD